MPCTVQLSARDDVWEHEPRASPREMPVSLSHLIQLGTSGCFRKQMIYTTEAYIHLVCALSTGQLLAVSIA
jgi:hypothetical protein